MIYKLEQDENGDYAKLDGTRYRVNECNKAYTPEGKNVGYTFFSSAAEMCATWGLFKIASTQNPVAPDLNKINE